MVRRNASAKHRARIVVVRDLRLDRVRQADDTRRRARLAGPERVL